MENKPGISTLWPLLGLLYWYPITLHKSLHLDDCQKISCAGVGHSFLAPFLSKYISSMNRSRINKGKVFVPYFCPYAYCYKICNKWEGLSQVHDIKFHNSRSKIVTRTDIFSWSLIYGSSWSGPWITKQIHVKFHVSWQRFSNMASDWLAAVLPANQMPGLKICVN